MQTTLIIDTHPLWRTAIRTELARANHDPILEAASPSEAIRCMQSISPDLIVLDIDFNGMDGVNFIYDLRSTLTASTKICIFTHLPQRLFAALSLAAGANAYLSKAHGQGILKHAIDAINQGYRIIPETIALNLLEQYKSTHNRSQVLERLSTREAQVLELLLKGYSNTQTAQELKLSNKTISTYKHRVLTKLGVENLAHLDSMTLLRQTPQYSTQTLLFSPPKQTPS